MTIKDNIDDAFDGETAFSAGVGFVAAAMVVGLIFFNADKLKAVPVVGDLVEDARDGFAGKSETTMQRQGFFARIFGRRG